MWHIASKIRLVLSRYGSASLLFSMLLATGCAARTVQVATGDVSLNNAVEVARAQAVMPRVSHIKATRHYTLVASTQADLDEAAEELNSTARSFIALFGEEPRTVDVKVRAITAPDSITSSLRDDVRLLATGAWLRSVSHDWCDAVVADPRAFVDPPEQPLTCGGDMPDWLAMAAVQMLSDTTAEAQAAQVLAEPRTPLLPLAELFERHISPSDSVDPTGSDVAFVAQSISVARYLRLVEGSTVLADISRASTAGLPMREILRRLPRATTPEQLDKGWRLWLAAASANF